jgi:hypothetical protein
MAYLSRWVQALEVSPVRKALIAVLGPFALVAVSAIAYHRWDTGALPGLRPTYHPVTVASIDLDDRGVRIQGTAHFEVRLWQTMEDGERFFVFPLMKPGDTISRDIRVLVRTDRPPDDLSTYEDMIVDGLALPPGRQVGHKIKKSLKNQGYTFMDDVVLVESHAIRSPSAS